MINKITNLRKAQYTLIMILILFPVISFSQIRIACLGNSITWSTEGGTGYVAYLKQYLGSGYDTKNFGKIGYCAGQKVEHSIWTESEFKNIFPYKPHIVTIMLGTNDHKHTERWDLWESDFERSYQALIDTFQTMETMPLIIPVLPPHAGEGKWNIYGTVIYNELLPHIRNVAAASGLEYMDANTPTRDSIKYFYQIFPDSVHPNDAGHKVLADIFAEGIQNIYAKRTPRQKLLWYGSAPGATGNDSLDKPRLFAYPAPDSLNTGIAVLICPGGAYHHVSLELEGSSIASWLNEQGINAFVLQYRCNTYKHPIPLNDAKHAMRIIRHYADAYKLDTSKIGVMGFSAGGHLASTMLTLWDNGTPDHINYIQRKKSRPDFGSLIYPVITLSGPYAHTGSREYLLGSNPEQSLVDSLSTQHRVNALTPPCFLAHGDADDGVVPQNSAMFDSALQANGVASTLFNDAGKGHGYGLDGAWPDAFLQWLRQQGIVSMASASAKRSMQNRVQKIWPGQEANKEGLPQQIYFDVPVSGKEGVAKRYNARGAQIPQRQK
ncbi:MAG: prolyl oligopeptidase family serine peptidase [Fibrobacteria bacterium]|nr:prolyl oligopeptidase family serine peptidase [Fibrobacteria bacterium]